MENEKSNENETDNNSQQLPSTRFKQPRTSKPMVDPKSLHQQQLTNITTQHHHPSPLEQIQQNLSPQHQYSKTKNKI